MKNRAHGTVRALCTSAVHERETARGGLAQDLRPWGTDLPVSMGRCDAVLPLCDAVVGRSREGGQGQGHLCQAEAEDGKGRVQAPVARLCLCKSLASRRLLNSTQLNSPPLPSPLNAYPPRYTTRFGVGHARSSPRYYPTCGVSAQSERACAREYWCTKMPAASGLLASLSMDPSEPRCGVTRPTMGSNVLLTKTGLSKVRYISP